MASDEEMLRQLKAQADQRRRDYETAKARAYAMRELLAQDLAQLKDEYGCESLDDAEKMIAEREDELAIMLDKLAEVLG